MAQKLKPIDPVKGPAKAKATSHRLVVALSVISLLLLAIVGIGGYKLTREILNLKDANNNLSDTIDYLNEERNKTATNAVADNNTTNTTNATSNTTNSTGSKTDDTGKVSQVKIFLVAVDDNGKSGEQIGCGDSLVAVSKTITATTKPLEAALKELLAIKTHDYGESGLTTALYQSNLTVQSVSIKNGSATIKLTGTVLSGGTCDDPRIVAQLQQTALQFSSVKTADIYVNDVPLDQLF